jgi:hypothetical protein
MRWKVLNEDGSALLVWKKMAELYSDYKHNSLFLDCFVVEERGTHYFYALDSYLFILSLLFNSKLS